MRCTLSFREICTRSAGGRASRRAKPVRFCAGLVVVLVMAMALAVAIPVPSAGASHSDERPVFRPPVDGPVTDPFRPPGGPFASGNRGVEYATGPGDAVRAAAAGTVVFSGAVAGSLYVTVDHGEGLNSTYSYLLRIVVRVGARVAQGQVIAVAGERLHFGVRMDNSYVDPAGLIGVPRIRVRLVSTGPWRRYR